MNNSKLFDDISEVLKKSLSEKEFNQFFESINDFPEESDQDIEKSLNDKIQVEQEFPPGYDKRVFVDKISSLTEEMLNKKSHLEFLVNLAEVVMNYDENDLATDLIEEILEKSKSEKDFDLIKADTFLLSAKVNWGQAIWDEVFADTRTAEKKYKELDNLEGLADCQNLRGITYLEKGEIDKAEGYFEKAIKILSGNDNKKLKAKITSNLGVVYDLKGLFLKAVSQYDKALDLYKSLEDIMSSARTYHNLGMLNIKLENYEDAIEYFDECLSISLPNEFLSNCVIAFLGKAFVYTKTGNLNSAELFSDKAMDIAYRINDVLSIADVYKVKGMIQSKLNNFELSEEMFENSVRLTEEFDDKVTLAEAHKELSNLFSKVNSNLKADLHKDESKKLLDKDDLSVI